MYMYELRYKNKSDVNINELHFLGVYIMLWLFSSRGRIKLWNTDLIPKDTIFLLNKSVLLYYWGNYILSACLWLKKAAVPYDVNAKY